MPAVANGGEALIRFQHLVKTFGGTRALRDVSLDIFPGEIVALLGENGAGKSTLIKCLAGIHTPDSGAILYRGVPYQHRPTRFGVRQPVTFIHQDLGLIDWMSIAENMSLALGYPISAGLINWRRADAVAAKALAQIGCTLDPSMRVMDLSRTEKSLVAIARALAVEAEVIVLDEPSASLPADEVHRLFDALRPLKARGVGMIYVSHRLDEVFEIADRVAVMRDGQMVAAGAVADTNSELLVHMIVGKALEAFVSKPSTVAPVPMLEVKELRVEGAGPVDFTASRGEIIGLVGLRGAGQERIGRALFGLLPYRGSIRLDGTLPDLSSPRAAMTSGIGLIARERVDESTAQGLTIRENTYLNPKAFGRGLFQWLSPRSESASAQKIGERVGLRPNAPELAIEALSGGNQQKVVVGRWLGIGGKLLLAEDPTAGVDVGAKSEIYRLLEEALGGGLAVVVVSTDFEEVARICHRALVFSHGRIVSELSGDALSVPGLIHAASVAVKKAA